MPSALFSAQPHQGFPNFRIMLSPTATQPVTLEAMRAEIARESAMRRRVYARWIAAGTMTEGDACLHLARLRAIGELLEEIAAVGPSNAFAESLGRVREITLPEADVVALHREL